MSDFNLGRYNSTGMKFKKCVRMRNAVGKQANRQVFTKVVLKVEKLNGNSVTGNDLLNSSFSKSRQIS